MNPRILLGVIGIVCLCVIAGTVVYIKKSEKFVIDSTDDNLYNKCMIRQTSLGMTDDNAVTYCNNQPNNISPNVESGELFEYDSRMFSNPNPLYYGFNEPNNAIRGNTYYNNTIRGNTYPYN